MRLSSVVVAVVFLLSSAVLAQHSSGGGGGSSGGSSGGGSHASSGGSSSGSSSHSSSGGSSGGGSSHSFSSHASAGGSGASSGHTSAHSSGSSSHHSSVASSRSKVSSHSAAAKTAQPGKRSFLSFLRHPFRRSEPKPTEADLRKPVCKGEDCKKPAPEPAETSALVESELRRPVCKGKACACPPGEVQGKNGGCVAAPTNNSACAVGQICADSAHQCSANAYWNGTTCVEHQADCATINARAASVASEVRAAKAQMQSACSNRSAQECSGEKQNYDAAVERYRMLMNAAPANCRSLVPDPLSL